MNCHSLLWSPSGARGNLALFVFWCCTWPRWKRLRAWTQPCGELKSIVFCSDDVLDCHYPLPRVRLISSHHLHFGFHSPNLPISHLAGFFKYRKDWKEQKTMIKVKLISEVMMVNSDRASSRIGFSQTGPLRTFDGRPFRRQRWWSHSHSDVRQVWSATLKVPQPPKKRRQTRFAAGLPWKQWVRLSAKR